MRVLLQADAVSCQSLKQVAEKLGASLTSLVLAGNSLTAFHLVLNVIMVSDCLCWGCGGRGGGWNGWGGGYFGSWVVDCICVFVEGRDRDDDFNVQLTMMVI